MKWFAVSEECGWLRRRCARRFREGSLVDERFLAQNFSAPALREMEKHGAIRHIGDSATPASREPPPDEEIKRKRGRPPKGAEKGGKEA